MTKKPITVDAIALGQPVLIDCSNEEGKVIARAEYLNAEPQALIRYKAGDGRAVESWWSYSALVRL